MLRDYITDVQLARVLAWLGTCVLRHDTDNLLGPDSWREIKTLLSEIYDVPAYPTTGEYALGVVRSLRQTVYFSDSHSVRDRLYALRPVATELAPVGQPAPIVGIRARLISRRVVDSIAAPDNTDT